MQEERPALDATISGEIGGLGGDVTLDDLFGDDWMAAHTDSGSIAEFIESCDYEVEDQESFENIPDHEWDDHVAVHSEFDDWRSMLSAAVESYVSVARPATPEGGAEGPSAEASE
ncbi:hypothetical protein GL213_07280 [Halogeometricum borinquense]|uniref:Uncharacterized protein n=1 Tax=Halogeometricum borinquense TaxID=60847 RepID=A0A6C0UHM5_9EURY|nr:hypothetical protein [Halogeometricum borinquense]QIB74707.1 hypothetical protein G3I44_10680 [Halogeometricum borinquense]QIQ76338.1 hypothetical protein GL213_07280 [Halogeometricum borinquense]